MNKLRAKLERRRKASKDEYIEACPHNIDDDDGDTWMLEVGFLDGERHFCSLEPSDYDSEEIIKRWKRGESYHQRLEAGFHIPEIRRLVQEADERKINVPENYSAELRDQYEYGDVSGFTERELDEIYFAIKLEDALDEMWADCPLHFLLEMDDADLAFFVDAMARLPSDMRVDGGLFTL